MEKKIIKEHINLSHEIFNGSLEKVVENLEKEISRLKEKEYKDLVFEWHYDYGFQCIRLNYNRVETDRKLKEKIKILNRKKRKRKKLYLELRKEFETKT
jgi:hypothetical protein